MAVIALKDINTIILLFNCFLLLKSVTTSDIPPTLRDPPSISNVGATQLLISWKLWNKDHDYGNSTVDEYAVFLKKIIDKEYKEYGTTKGLNMVVEGLDPVTKYQFSNRIYTRINNEVKLGDYSPQSSAETLSLVPPQLKLKPIILDSDINKTEVLVKWTKWRKNYDVGNGRGVDRYEVYYRKSQLGDIFFKFGNTEKSELVVTGLEEDTKYDFAIKAFTNEGGGTLGPFGPPVQITTKKTELSALNYPPKIILQEILNDRMIVRWEAWNRSIDNGTGPVLKYRVEYRSINQENFTIAGTTNETNYLVIGLEQEKEYHIAIRTYDKTGWGTLSPTTVAKTIEYIETISEVSTVSSNTDYLLIFIGIGPLTVPGIYGLHKIYKKRKIEKENKLQKKSRCIRMMSFESSPSPTSSAPSNQQTKMDPSTQAFDVNNVGFPNAKASSYWDTKSSFLLGGGSSIFQNDLESEIKLSKVPSNEYLSDAILFQKVVEEDKEQVVK